MKDEYTARLEDSCYLGKEDFGTAQVFKNVFGYAERYRFVGQRKLFKVAFDGKIDGAVLSYLVGQVHSDDAS